MPCPFDFFWLNDHMRSTSSILIGANAGETLGEFCGAVFVGQRERNSTQPPPQFVYDNMCKYIIFEHPQHPPPRLTRPQFSMAPIAKSMIAIMSSLGKGYGT